MEKNSENDKKAVLFVLLCTCAVVMVNSESYVYGFPGFLQMMIITLSNQSFVEECPYFITDI